MPRVRMLSWKVYVLLAAVEFPVVLLWCIVLERDWEMYGWSVQTFDGSEVSYTKKMSFLLHFDFSHGVECNWM